jgi:hypothetical protein
MRNPNDEIRMSKEARNPKAEGFAAFVSGFRASDFFGHSSFVIRHFIPEDLNG